MNDPLEEYKAFIDGLVAIREGVEARMIRKGRWPYGLANDANEGRIGTLLAELTPGQREVVAQLVQQVRASAIHDVLVLITDRRYRLRRNGVELAFEPFGTESYYDFVARSAGDEWPAATDQGTNS
jgi:hypothetical protein